MPPMLNLKVAAWPSVLSNHRLKPFCVRFYEIVRRNQNPTAHFPEPLFRRLKRLLYLFFDVWSREEKRKTCIDTP